MEFQVKFNLNENLYVKDPENSELGKSIVKNSIDLIYEIGFEQFTFKKLAQKIDSTEATIYRYFSSKHKLLTYILNWYWSYLELIAKMRLSEVKNPKDRIQILLEIITHQEESENKISDYNLDHLHQIVISESSKAYLVKEVDEINKILIFSPLKSLCAFISDIIKEINPEFPYPKSLASTILETAHDQHFFSEHLPKLTDYSGDISPKQYVLDYLNCILFSVLKH